MKKIMKVLLAVVIVVVMFGGINYVRTYKTPLEKLSDEVNIDLTKGKIMNLSQDGFIDVETHAAISFPLTEMNKVKDNSIWIDYPMNTLLSEKVNHYIDNKIIDIYSINKGYYRVIEDNASVLSILMYDSINEIMYYYCIK